MQTTNHWRTIRWAFWLGWQIESNWANPILFALYTLIKPLTGTLLFVCMFRAALAANPDTRLSLLAFTYLGNALYMFASAIAVGMGNALVTDREHYGMLKYWRISPVGLQAFLVGRGLAHGVRGMIGSVITILVGLFLPLGLNEQLELANIQWGWFLFHWIVGTFLLLAVGLILCGAVLNMARHGMFLSEGVGTALYLLSGALFPLSVLPEWLQRLSLLLPHTYWMEGLRRALLRREISSGPLASLTELELAGIVAGMTVLMFVVAQVVFRRAEQRALRLGRYDLSTGF